MSEPVPNARPPVLLGCSALALGVVLLGAIAVTMVVFLESGADSGDVTLEPVGAYPPGTYTRVLDEHFYIVSLPGEVLALSDIDAANRAAEGRRCRVEPIPAGDPALRRALDDYATAFTAKASGMTLVFRETCFGALYDGAGVRLNGEGPNLDRFEVGVDEEGRLVVSTGERLCTLRSEAGPAIPVDCPR